MRNFDIIKTDILVVGGGGAGCRAAIESASRKCRVVLVSKFPVGKAGATVVADFYVAPLAVEESPGQSGTLLPGTWSKVALSFLSRH